jgi:hypothetical protein
MIISPLGDLSILQMQTSGPSLESLKIRFQVVTLTLIFAAFRSPLANLWLEQEDGTLERPVGLVIWRIR